jgi:hypothetical protein
MICSNGRDRGLPTLAYRSLEESPTKVERYLLDAAESSGAGLLLMDPTIPGRIWMKSILIAISIYSSCGVSKAQEPTSQKRPMQDRGHLKAWEQSMPLDNGQAGTKIFALLVALFGATLRYSKMSNLFRGGSVRFLRQYR